MASKKKSDSKISVMTPFEVIHKAVDDEIKEDASLTSGEAQALDVSKNYRKSAMQKYVRDIDGVGLYVCAMCGFGIAAILEVAHISQDRSDNSLDNLAILCPNCHKMHDIGLIPPEVVRAMRDFSPKINWKLRIKDAGVKAADTRRLKAAAAKRSVAAKKAVATRKANNSPSAK